MAVRFLPTPEERPPSHREERGDLAEVIEFRARLRRPHAEGATEPAGDVLGNLQARIADVTRSSEAAPTPPADSREQRNIATSNRPAAREAAVKLLARRALSSGELRSALLDAEYSADEVEDAVAECESSLYLDDTDLARSITRKLREAKGESRTRIRQKLRERHLPDAAIEAALADLDESEELQLLTQTAKDRAKRMVGIDRQVAERRLLGFLARRGWSGERATRAVREALEHAGSARANSSIRFL